MSLLLRRLQLNVLTIPAAAQRQVMISDHSAKTTIGHEQLENLAVLWSLCDQIAYGDNSIVLAESSFLEQLYQLVITTVDVTNYDGPTVHD
jgi:hypothetical protein